ncbi:hypothetical protein MRX96_038586 [Rhipicephalus microplus]
METHDGAQTTTEQVTGNPAEDAGLDTKCVFCKQDVSETSEPQLLPCLHTACKLCIPTDPTVRCAECQQEISSSDVINHLFLMEHLASNSEAKAGETAGTHTCTNCDDSSSTAAGFCVDCQDWLCQACIDAHQRVRVTKDHTIRAKDELEGDKPAALGQKYMFCENHKQEQLKLYCETCDKLTCRDCQLQEHKDHKYQFISSAWCPQPGEQTAPREITQQEQKVTSDIKMFAVRFITEINKRGKLLLQELNDICNKKKLQLSSKNEELMALSLKLAQCQKFAEAAINRGSDVALVFSKKAICSQMRTVLKTRCEIPNPQHVVDIKFLYEAEFLTNYIANLGCILVDQQPIVGTPPWSATAKAAALNQHRGGPPPDASVPRYPEGFHPAMPTGPGPGLYHHQRQGAMGTAHGMPPNVRPPPYPGPYVVPGGGYPGAPPPQLRHLLNQGPMNQKGGASMAALSHMARMGPSAAGGTYTMQKSPHPAPQHPSQAMRPQPGVRQQHGMPQPPKVIMLDSASARAAALQQQQMRRVSGSRDGTPPSTNRLPSHLVAGSTSSGSGSPRLPETSVLERNSAITITPVGAGPSSTSSSSSSRTASPSVSVVRIKEEPKSPGEQQLPSCSGDVGPSSNTLRSSASPAETAAGIASRSLNDFANRSIGNLLQSTGAKDTSQEKGAQGGQPQADSSCSPSSIAEPVCSSSSRTPSTVSASTANSTTVTTQGSGGVQDCFEDLSTLEELLKIGDKSFDLPAQDASSSSSSTIAVATSNGPTAASKSSSAAQASPSSCTPPKQNNVGGDTANGTGLKIVETHSLQTSDPNEDWCSVCHDGGELLCCGSCPRVYHLHEDWTCLLCLDILKCNIPRESAGSKRKTPVGLSGRELLICERILLHLFCHELSVPFHIPVSRTVPNYYKVITKPMDLTTIKQKLSPSHFNHYEDVPEFLADVKLIFKNCYTFNHKESQVCQQARTLERDFDALVQQFLPEHYAELKDAQPDPQPGYESDPERRKRARTSSTSSSPPESAVVLSWV